MEEDEKSPFRRWLENEGVDSQTSFNLPSPRLVEKSGRSTPELLFYEVEQDLSDTFRGASFSVPREDCRLTQTPTQNTAKGVIYSKFAVSPETSPRRSKGELPSPLRYELASHHAEHRTPRRRGLSPSYSLHRQYLMKRQMKADGGGRRAVEGLGAAGFHLTCVKKKIGVRNLPPGVTMYGTPFGISSPKTQTIRSRAPESPRVALRPSKETTMSHPYRTFTNPRKLMETVTKMLSPKSRPAVHPSSPLKPRPSKSPARKFGRSATPLERSGLRRL